MSQFVNSSTGSYVMATAIALYSTAMVFAATAAPALA